MTREQWINKIEYMLAGSELRRLNKDEWLDLLSTLRKQDRTCKRCDQERWRGYSPVCHTCSRLKREDRYTEDK